MKDRKARAEAKVKIKRKKPAKEKKREKTENEQATFHQVVCHGVLCFCHVSSEWGWGVGGSESTEQLHYIKTTCIRFEHEKCRDFQKTTMAEWIFAAFKGLQFLMEESKARETRWQRWQLWLDFGWEQRKVFVPGRVWGSGCLNMGGFGCWQLPVKWMQPTFFSSKRFLAMRCGMQILRSVSQRMFRARPSVSEIEFWSVAFCPLLSIRQSYAGAIEARVPCQVAGVKAMVRV